jgi:adenylylsulfate kinase
MERSVDKHVVWHEQLVSRRERNILNKHRSILVWFTGLSASGKSTIAHHLEKELFERGVRSYVLDGDNVRHGINSNLGFSREDRHENLRRIAEVCKLMVDSGVVVLAAFISPYHEDRQFVREVVGKGDFVEVYVQCPVEVCEQRDPKGLYKKARAGEIKNYTGINAPYEEPRDPDIILDTTEFNVDDAVQKVLQYLDSKKVILLM